MSSARKEPLQWNEVLNKAAASAMRGGTAGACAMGANVACLMWMRTTVNYQYRNGTSFPVALRTLYADGGIPRFYRGVAPALIQGPMSRFGDTAANTGVLTLLDSMDATKDMSVGIKTVAASTAAALFRIFLMPIDTVKTTMQVRVVVLSFILCPFFISQSKVIVDSFSIAFLLSSRLRGNSPTLLTRSRSAESLRFTKAALLPPVPRSSVTTLGKLVQH